MEECLRILNYQHGKILEISIANVITASASITLTDSQQFVCESIFFFRLLPGKTIINPILNNNKSSV